MEYRPDIPTIIMRRQDLTYNEKSFLLWCWINRDSTNQYILMSKKWKRIDGGLSKHILRNRSITWYADYFGVPQQTMSDVFIKLRAKHIIITKDKGKAKETTYVNFNIFN